MKELEQHTALGEIMSNSDALCPAKDHISVDATLPPAHEEHVNMQDRGHVFTFRAIWVDRSTLISKRIFTARVAFTCSESVLDAQVAITS